MRFSALTISLLTAAASAYASSFVARQTTYPSCSLPCLAAAPVGTCGSNEVACLCKNDAFVSNVTACFNSSCTDATDLKLAVNISRESCRLSGVVLTSVPVYLPSSIVGGVATSTPTTSTKSGASKTSRDALLGLGAAAAAFAALCI